MKSYNFRDIACKIPVKRDNNWYMTPLLEFCKGIEAEFNVRCKIVLSQKNNLVTRYIIKIFAINNPIINDNFFEFSTNSEDEKIYLWDGFCKNEKELYEHLESLIRKKLTIIEKIESYGL